MDDHNENNNTYHHKNLKEALIREAMAMLDRKPYEAITVRELTDALGVSRTAIYRHFDSKEHLFQAVILQGYAQLTEALRSLNENVASHVKEKLSLTAKGYIDFAMASPPRYRLMMGDKLMKVREESCAIEDTAIEDAFALLTSLVLEAQEEGLFRREDPSVQAVAIWSLMHGQASLLIDGHPMVLEMRESLHEVMVQMMVGGLK